MAKMAEPTLKVEGLTKSFGGVVATNEIDFEIKKDLVDNIKLIGKDDDNLKKN